jgi:hypothetical protein
LESGTLSPTGGARSARGVADAAYQASGEINDLLVVIRDLKKAVANPNISVDEKARDISVIASRYKDSGQNPLVLQEVFSDEPYRSQYVEGNIPLSLANLAKLANSYKVSARTAIAVAASDVDMLVDIQNLAPNVRSQIDASSTVAEIVKYLNLSDDHYQRQMSKDNPATAAVNVTGRYASTQFFRAYTVGGLAYLGVGDYRSQYKKNFDAFIAIFEQKGDTDSAQYLPYAYFMYANFLVLLDKDNVGASANLHKLVQFVTADSQFEVNQFVTFLRAQKDAGPSFRHDALVRLMALSSEFKALVDRVQNGQ